MIDLHTANQSSDFPMKMGAWRKTRNLLALLLFFAVPVNATHEPNGPLQWDEEFDLCIPGKCGSGMTGTSTDAKVTQIIDPNSPVYEVEFDFQIAGSRCGPSQACGFQVILGDDECLAGACSTSDIYFRITYKAAGAGTNSNGEFTRLATFGTSGTSLMFTGAGDVTTPHTMKVTIDTGAKTAYYYLDDVLYDTVIGTGTLVGFGGLQVSLVGGQDATCTEATTCSTRSVTMAGEIRDVIVTHGAPTAPNAISAQVIATQPACQVELRWTVSSNDPDPEQGDYEYEIWINGAFNVVDPTTTQDADGLRYALKSIGGVSPGRNDFKVLAENITTNEQSGFSPTVSVDCAVLHDSDTADTGVGGNDNLLPGGGAAQSDDNPLGLVIRAVDTAWGFPEGTTGWLVGIAIILAIAFVCTRPERGQPFITMFGVIAGEAITTMLGLTEIWLLLITGLLVIIMGAVVLFGGRGQGDAE